MTDRQGVKSKGAGGEAPVVAGEGKRSPKFYASLLCGAAVMLGGAYLATSHGVIPALFDGGGNPGQTAAKQDIERVRRLSNDLKGGARGSIAAANEIIDLATKVRLAYRQQDMPELDNAVATAGLALLRNGDASDALVRRERARFALTLINLPGAKVDLGYELLPLSTSKEETFFLLGTMRTGLEGLPEARQDQLRAGMAKFIAISAFSHAADAAFLQCADIVDPGVRAEAMHDVALLRMAAAADRASSPQASAMRAGKADKALIHAVRGQAAKANVMAATLLALSINDTAMRDRMLQFVVSEGARKETRWQLVPAVMGIANQRIRDETSLQFVYRATNDGFVDEAQRVSAAISDPGFRIVSRSVIAEHLAGLGYALQVDAILPSLDQIRDLNGGMREIAASYAAVALGAMGRIDAANEALDLTSRPNRVSTDAAIEIAENLSKQPGQFEQIKGLFRFAEADEQPNLSARAAIALARTGDVSAATKFVDSIKVPAIRIKAGALLALEVHVPEAWTHTLAAEADKVRPADGDKYGLLAAFAVALGQTDEGMRLLASASDEQLTSRIGNALARQLALKDRVADLRKIPLIGSTDQQRAKDAQLRSAALALADKGRIDRAAYLAREMTSYKTRAATMRSIAMNAARDADTHKALDGALQTSPEPFLASSLDAPVVRRRSFNIYETANGRLGGTIPTLPNASIHTASSINTKVPVLGVGEEPSFAVVPLANNGYNKKFLTARSAFEEVVPGGPTIVMRAQGTSYPVYLHIDRGVVDMPTLYNRLIEQGYADIIERKGRIYTLRVPLFIANSAKLVVSDATVDELRLSVERAAYIVSAGQVYFTGVRVSSWSEKSQTPALITEETKSQFRPFYIAWSNSETFVARSKFEALGYSSGKAYGFSFSNGPLALMSVARVVREPRGTIVDSTFEHMLYGFYSWEAADVALVGNEYRNNLTYGIDPHDWSKRLLVAYNTAYGSQKKHGIIGSRHVEDSWFLGNMSFDNHGSGLMMDRYSGRNVLYANSSFDNHGSGVAIYESPCNIVSSNQVFRNDGNGVFVRNSWDVGVFNNSIKFNRKLGVNAFSIRFVTRAGAPQRNLELDPYERFVTMAVVKNTVAHNQGGGIGAQGVGATQLRSNTLIGNPKRAYIGDLRNVEFDIVRQAERGILIGGSCPKPKITYVCNFAGQGYLSDQLMAAASARPLFRTCPPDTTVNAKTPQSDLQKDSGVAGAEMQDDDDDAATKVNPADRARQQAGAAR